MGVTLHGAREVRNWLEVYGEPVPEPTRPMATGALGRVTTPPGAPPGRRSENLAAYRPTPARAAAGAV